jgi:hypothetical protein
MHSRKKNYVDPIQKKYVDPMQNVFKATVRTNIRRSQSLKPSSA